MKKTVEEYAKLGAKHDVMDALRIHREEKSSDRFNVVCKS